MSEPVTLAVWTGAAKVVLGERTDGQITIVELGGAIDSTVTPGLREVFRKLLADPSTRLLVDMSQVVFVDSSGIGLFVTMHKRAFESGAALAMGAIRPNVRRVFTMTRTDRVLSMYDDLSEAVTILRSV